MTDQASNAGVSNAGVDHSGLSEALGGSAALATVLSVSTRQLSRWASGLDPVNAETGRVLADLDLIVSRARMLWGPKAVPEWFQGSNASLNGGRPVDVLTARRFPEVRDALEAAESATPG